MTEMRELEEAFLGCSTSFLTYESSRSRKAGENVHSVPNFWERPWTIPTALIKIISVILREKPDLMVSTGAEIAIPAFVIAKVADIETVYIESCARVNCPSATGKIVYLLADHFFVQWRTLLNCFGAKAAYQGGLL